jgi:hypothetical protein
MGVNLCTHNVNRVPLDNVISKLSRPQIFTVVVTKRSIRPTPGDTGFVQVSLLKNFYQEDP